MGVAKLEEPGLGGSYNTLKGVLEKPYF